MTVEEKAKAYDEVIKRARNHHDNDGLTLEQYETIDIIFPELKESEDERVRKNLIGYIKGISKNEVCEETKDSWIAWLEKQGEKFQYWKPSEEQLEALDYAYNSCPDTERGNYYEGVLGTIIDDLHKLSEKQGEQKPIDKLEPKFHEGDWVVWQDKCYKVNYNGCGYELVDQDGLSTSLEYGTIDENAHIWDVTTDAKDGDILADKDNNIGIFQECEGIYWNSYIYLGCDGTLRGFSIGGQHELTDVHPVTKEQRDLLFQKMRGAGYEWDAEHKQPKKIEQEPTGEEMKTLLRTEYEKGRADAITEMQKPVDCTDCTNSKGCINCKDGNMKETLVQNPVWSEEDEKIGKDLIDFCIKCSQGDTVVNSQDDFAKWATWLKSLKERIKKVKL